MYSSYYTDYMSEDEKRRAVEIPTLTGLMEHIQREYSDLVAIRTSEKELNYATLLDDVAKCRGYLASKGIKEGDHVALMLKNEYDFVRLFLAITTLGAVAVLVPMQIPVPNVVPILSMFNAKMLIHSRVFGPAYKSMNPPFEVINQDEIVLDATAPMASGIERDTPAAILFTGGTTGRAKGCLLSHGNLMRGTINGVYGVKGSWFSRYYALIPFTHVFGLVRNGLTALYTGSSLFMCEEMKNLMRDLPVCKPTIMVLVPGLAEMIWGLMMSRGKEAAGGEINTMILGGAPVPHKLVEKLTNMGIRTYPGYGLTETANLVSGCATPLEKHMSVGRPYAYEELRIVDGELWVKGENVMLGYYNNPAANAAAFEDDWFKTGDLARIDEDGDIFIVGRTKNVIILDNGENVSPEEIEDQLNELPFIQDSLVYEDKNKAGGTIIAVEIFPALRVLEAMHCPDPAPVIQNAVDQLNARMPSYMKVSRVVIRDKDFERSGSMKIIRK